MLAPVTNYRAVSRRLETDAELRRRLVAAIGNGPIVYVSGTSLDDVAWRYAQIQRRIVEDVSHA